jgi:16S rRNA (guanosine(1370)-2'-O)-methyltransferase
MILNVAVFYSPVITDAKSLAGRLRKRIILLEGKRLVNEAVKTRQDLKSVFFTHMELLEGLPVEQLATSGVKLYKVKPDHMKVWSDTVSPQGIMGRFTYLKATYKSCQAYLQPVVYIIQ